MLLLALLRSVFRVFLLMQETFVFQLPVLICSFCTTKTQPEHQKLQISPGGCVATFLSFCCSICESPLHISFFHVFWGSRSSKIRITLGRFFVSFLHCPQNHQKSRRTHILTFCVFCLEVLSLLASGNAKIMRNNVFQKRPDSLRTWCILMFSI